MACPLRSTGITPLHRYCGTVAPAWRQSEAPGTGAAREEWAARLGLARASGLSRAAPSDCASSARANSSDSLVRGRA